MQGEDGKDEQRVPEDVPPVGLSAQATSRDPGIDIPRVLGDAPEEVVDVEPQRGQGRRFPVLDLE
jgi:hypothetical protein